MAANATSAAKVQSYKDSLISKAEKLLLVGFPEKIVELNELLSTKKFSERKFEDFHQDLNIPIPDPIVLNNHDGPPNKKRKPNETNSEQGSKVMALTTGSIPLNKELTDVINIVKPHIRQLVEHANELKMWVSFLIPKIEDGNNFGVSVQEDTLAEIQSVESEAAAFFDQISRYFISRGKIISKVAKYPHISDYRRSVQELDEKEYLSLWLVLCEIRNRYCSLHDIVTKNLEKIKKPRSSNAESLY